MASRDMPPTKHGHNAFDAISALQKTVRRSDPEAAAYWAMQLAPGYGNWLWARLRVIAVEDVSPEATGLVADVRALNEQWKADKDGDNLAVVRAVVALAIAPKNRLCDWLVLNLCSSSAPRRDVPDEALDMHTRRGKQMGRGIEHFMEEGGKLIEWTGDLDELEREQRDLFVRISESPSGRTDVEPAQNDEHDESGQLPSKTGRVGQMRLSTDRRADD